MFEYYSDIAVTKAMRRLIALQQHFLPQRAGSAPQAQEVRSKKDLQGWRKRSGWRFRLRLTPARQV